MGSSDKFDLNEAIDKWGKSNFSQKELIPADKEEFENHILDSIRELKETGLEDEEAFTISQMKFGCRKDWGEDMQALNEDNFQLKQIVLVFSGVLLFILSYNFIICVNRIILLLSNVINGDIEGNIENAELFFRVVYALSISAVVALYFIHKPVKWLLNNISVNNRWVYAIIASLIVVVVLERALVPLVSNIIPSKVLKGNFFSAERLFEYIYFFIVAIGFIVVYVRYYKQYFVIKLSCNSAIIYEFFCLQLIFSRVWVNPELIKKSLEL